MFVHCARSTRAQVSKPSPLQNPCPQVQIKQQGENYRYMAGCDSVVTLLQIPVTGLVGRRDIQVVETAPAP
jgi:hypothetical protein